MSAITRIPPNILREFLELAILSTTNPLANSSGTAGLEDTVGFQRKDLRLVCKKWNDVILTDPRLWTDISLDCSRWPQEWDSDDEDSDDGEASSVGEWEDDGRCDHARLSLKRCVPFLPSLFLVGPGPRAGGQPRVA